MRPLRLNPDRIETPAGGCLTAGRCLRHEDIGELVRLASSRDTASMPAILDDRAVDARSRAGMLLVHAIHHGRRQRRHVSGPCPTPGTASANHADHIAGHDDTIDILPAINGSGFLHQH